MSVSASRLAATLYLLSVVFLGLELLAGVALDNFTVIQLLKLPYYFGMGCFLGEKTKLSLDKYE